MAKEYLKSGAVEAAMGYLQQVLADPHCPKRTKVQAAKTLVANAAKISSKKTQLQLDGAVTSLSMSDLLALAGQADTTTGCISGVSEGVAGSLPASVADIGDHSSTGAVPVEAQEHQDEAPRCLPLPSSHETPGRASSTNDGKEDPTEALPDTSSSEGGPELDG